MYCVRKSIAKTMSTSMLHERQELYAEVLPKWEDRIYNLAVDTFPKVDQRLNGVDDLQQELRIALWEAILSFDSSRGVDVATWIYKILKQAPGLIAKLQYHNMPHTPDGHGAQLLALKDDSEVFNNEGESESYGAQLADPDAIGLIEVGLEEDECKRTIRPALKEGFEQDVFDLFMNGYTGGEIVRELGLDHNRGGDARVSSVRLKIKIAYALIYRIALSDVSSAQNTDYLAGRLRCRLASRKKVEPEEIPPNTYPQFA